MLTLLLIAALHAWGFYLYRKYRQTSDKAWLRSLGNFILFATAPVALTAGARALVFPGQAWLVYLAVIAGAGAGLALKSAYYEGDRKLLALLHVGIYVAALAFLISSLNYFRKPIFAAHAVKAVAAQVPESAERIDNFTAERKAEVGARLAAQLASPDRFVRMGALLRLQAIPAAIPAALPAMTAAIADSDEETLEILFPMLQRLGPAAADTVPALESRLAGLPADSRARFYAQDALKVIAPPPASASGN